MYKQIVCLHCFHIEYACLKPFPPRNDIAQSNGAILDGAFMGNDLLLVMFFYPMSEIRGYHPIPSSCFHRAKIAGTSMV